MLARRVVELERARLGAKQPNLGFSTIDGGAIQAINEDDALTMIIGQQFDGTNTAAVVTGPTPPTPTVPFITEAIGVLRIYWDGTWDDDAVAPMDFSRVLIYAQPSSEYIGPDPLNQALIVGQISSATGGEITAALPEDVEHVIYLVAWTQAGKHSAASDVALGTPLALPDPTGPTDPPTASPELTVTGLTASILLSAEPVDPTTEIIYQMSTDYDPDTGIGTWVDLPRTPTRDQIYSVSTLVDGFSPLAPEVTYWFRTLATNAIDPAPTYSTPKAGVLDLEAVEFAADAVFTARLDSPLVVTNRIQVGSGYWDPSELYLPAADGTITQLGGEGNRFDGHITGRSADFKDNTNLYKKTVIHGTARAADGIDNPTSPPGLSRSWDSYFTELAENEPFVGTSAGMTQNVTEPTQWVVVHDFFGSEIRSVVKDTGVVNPFLFPSFSNFFPYGIVSIGSNYYLLGRDSTRSDRIFVYVLNSSFTKTGEWEYSPGGKTRRPTIGSDAAGNVVIAQCFNSDHPTQSNKIGVFSFTTAGVPTATGTIGSSSVVCQWTAGTDLGGLYVGSADFGGARIVIATRTGAAAIRAFNTSGTTDVTHNWTRAGGQDINGLVRDSTTGLFSSYDALSRIWKYTARPVDQAVDAAYTNYDGNSTGGFHETMISDISTFTWPARTRLEISMPPAPEVGVVGDDVANAHRVYVGPSAGTLRLQADPGAGVDNVTLVALDTGSITPPGSNGFDTVGTAPGEFQSTAKDSGGLDPMWRLVGDGSWTLGTLSSDDDGVAKVHGITVRPVQHGRANTGSFSAANTDKNINVVFPVPFAVGQTPSITLGVEGASSQNIRYVPTIHSITNEGFSLSVSRATGTTAFIIAWTAVANA